MENYILNLENKNGDYISLEGKILDEIKFPEFPRGGEKIILHDSDSLSEYFRKRAKPAEELQKRFCERIYVIEKINFNKKFEIFAIEK